MKFRIPTIVGFFLVILLVAGFAVVTEGFFRTPSGASASNEPKNIQMTNITDSAFTVSWLTDDPATGTLEVAVPSKGKQVYFDERDATGKLGSYTTHSVTVRALTPASDHSAVIVSGGRKYQNNGKPYVVRTASTLSLTGPGLEPAYGSILTTDGLPAEGALVYLTVEGGQTLSSLTKASGLWLIPLNLVRTADLTSFLPVIERMREDINAHHSGSQTVAVTDTLNDSPVPDMTMGKTYDFQKLNAKTVGNQVALRQPTPPTAPVMPAGGSGGTAVLGQTTGKVALTQPAEGAALTSNLPLFAGTGVPGKFMAILLGITNPISDSVKVAEDGLWRYTPKNPLATGKQSVTISSVDGSGKPVAITHSFQILKSGTQVLGEATPSADPAATPTAEPTIEETPIPTSTLAGEPVPTSGTTLPTILLLVLGLGLLAGGAVIFMK